MELRLDSRISTELAGYRIEALLGRGERSVVYRATDVRMRRLVALKLIDPLRSGDPQFPARMLAETELVRSLDHSAIVPIYESGQLDGLLYVAMGYIDGFDLRTALSVSGQLEPLQAIGIVGAVADALDSVRWARGLVHGNVKPSNILIPSAAGDVGSGRAYLTDFGTGTTISSGERLRPAGGLPTELDFLAPEQIDGRPVNPRTDVYALGCVLSECVIGEPRARGSSAMTIVAAHRHDERMGVGGLDGDRSAHTGSSRNKPDRRNDLSRGFDPARRGLRHGSRGSRWMGLGG